MLLAYKFPNICKIIIHPSQQVNNILEIGKLGIGLHLCRKMTNPGKESSECAHVKLDLFYIKGAIFYKRSTRKFTYYTLKQSSGPEKVANVLES